MVGHLGNRCRQGEDDVEVLHWEQVGLPVGQPFGASEPLALRAVPIAAGIICDPRVPAVAALLDMATECRRSAG
jgi:hypothetical protein